IERVLKTLSGKLAETITLVISKSGGTPEPRNGMLIAGATYKSAGLDFAKHAVAITMPGSHLDKIAVGDVPPTLQGIDVDAMLAGAAAIDIATRQHDTAKNPAALLALMWYHAT